MTGLEDLKFLCEDGYFQLQSYQEDEIAIECINNIEKELKAFEIIKEKRIDVDSLLYYLKTNACDDSVLSWYNEYIVKFDEERILTQQELDLLKEALDL